MQKTLPRIALITPRYRPAIGGIERHVERVATGLLSRGYEVDVLATDPSGKLPPVESLDGVTVRRFPTLLDDATYFVSPRLLRWLWANADRYALLHAHNYQTLMPVIGWQTARHHRLPLVVTPHYHGTGHTPFRAILHVPYRPIGSRAMRAADVVIANSLAEAGWIERDFGVTPRFIPNGVDVPGSEVTAPDMDPREVSLLAVGRLERYKQVQRIVTALPYLPAEQVLTVIGEGPAMAEVEQEAIRLGVSDRVRMRGHVSAAALAGHYARADLFVSLSREESFGMTLLEAAAAGAPVLASDIPAHREIKEYAGPGRIALVPAETASGPLAAAMQAQRSVGKSVDRAGWHLPTWEANADAVAAIYRHIAESRPSQA